MRRGENPAGSVPGCGAAGQRQAVRRRSLLVSGAGGAAAGMVSACARSEETAPNDAMQAVAEVAQPHDPSPGPQEQPTDWIPVNVSGISFSLLSAMEGPTPHRDWGPYTVSYDMAASSQEGFDQRLMVSALDTTTTADGLRQTVDLAVAGLVTGYAQLARVSWQRDSGTAVERTAFSWGPEGLWCGWTWILASGVGAGVVTLLGTYTDDGLRNGVEDTLDLVRRQS
ncbi:hypothetical protein [Actinomyces lilanjuaniae]|uniref:hypothetical protein n=1 Tax=Actinomyces lilanjuaniae TaxID=2321394 RepID=UPI001FA995E5|nr:hypothetical protein [Actinomyces lilanjuaniae]